MKIYKEEVPTSLASVLAIIEGQGDLGKQTWPEVVYFDCEIDHEWKSYSGSNTFSNGERVIKWIYVEDVFGMPEPPPYRHVLCGETVEWKKSAKGKIIAWCPNCEMFILSRNGLI
jgi:hypothetical protein